jgi:hypothetical protein
MQSAAKVGLLLVVFIGFVAAGFDFVAGAFTVGFFIAAFLSVFAMGAHPTREPEIRADGRRAAP